LGSKFAGISRLRVSAIRLRRVAAESVRGDAITAVVTVSPAAWTNARRDHGRREGFTQQVTIPADATPGIQHISGKGKGRGQVRTVVFTVT
jgi:hypothetical protein